MHIIASLIYFLLFIVLAFIAMFLGGVTGVAGTFYLMVEPGDIEKNLNTAIAVLVSLWILIIMLRQQNKKVIKRKKQLKLDAAEKEA
ncbi:MAG: hypothetical protein KZQ64_07220 [gamma proteobacterium symbiont of Bathyaustriella thionipta]|nr:hypothetical protein [gamma proteobacterium symbiont of Bathyaustriella thionipta]MCU7950939.1 hypothetical protein [gamma proteobacterium symbiont of Bathyaustriella thionipta]MCU7953163.1 hypothetical protein [gamma proteobacterium symbiont of Bathyaustriella thionipta]MCU7957430.1 hypothetical protein [gamma proteobacterium symbiont of Bathyaustriella thionipta]MCU7968926.1 hypothetical protein [gamma proteobacterium symbiont of Bathyaustriella thionipta]